MTLQVFDYRDRREGGIICGFFDPKATMSKSPNVLEPSSSGSSAAQPQTRRSSDKPSASPRSHAEWTKKVLGNMKRTASDESYRQEIARKLS